VSAYDQAAGLLLSLLLILGFGVSLMFLLWYSSRTWLPKPALAVTIYKNQDTGGDNGPDGSTESSERNLEEPAPAELSEVAPAKVEEILDAISLDATARILEADLTFADSSKTAGKSGVGPSDSIGTPPWERWEVQLSASTLEEYKRQLDFFKIELGVAGGGSPVVTYVSNVAAKPQVRTGNPEEEKRLRFLHRSGALRSADRKIASAAGVDTEGKVVFQFYSQKTYDTLLTLENIAMRPRNISQVRRTVFGVRGSPGNYEFYVISQDYRS